MSDQWPGWTPPGDAREGTAGDTSSPETAEASTPVDDSDAPDDAAAPRQDTVAFSTEHTQRIEREASSPPPPPPPGAAGPPPPPPAGTGWAPPGGPPATPTSSWTPPPTSTSRSGVVVAAVVGAVVLVLGLAVIGLLVARSSGDVAEDRVVDEAPAGPDDDGEAAVVDPDLSSQTEAVLRTIDASERRMLAFQSVVFDELDEDGTVGAGAEAIATEAQDTGDDLTDLRSELRSLAGGEAGGFDGLRDIRDAYATHMDAWIDYVDAVSGSPTMAAPESSDASSLWDEISRSGEVFVDAIETGLPDDVPPRLQDLADVIVERGFSGGGPSGELVRAAPDGLGVGG